jgi:hypothetical protein
MDLEDFKATFAIRPIDQNLTIEPPCPQKSRIENFRPVGGSEEYDADAGVKPVELCKQLVERLFLFVDTAECAWHATATQGVEFVDEDDAWCRPPSLLKEITHAGSPDPNKHFDELGARDREERNTSFTGYGARQERLSGAPATTPAMIGSGG